jgi:hypothetical protein
MSGKLLEGATGVCAAAAGVARHVVWYLSYQIDGAAGARGEATGPIGHSKS